MKLFFNLFKLKNYFSYKEPIPNDLKFFLVHKFTCASYIGEACRHFKTRIEEYIKTEFNSKFDLKIKEALHGNWKKPNLNAQQNHLALTLSL